MNVKQQKNNLRVEFLMTFFENKEGYEEKEINGFWLIKQWDGGGKNWTVHIYPKESYKNYKKGQEKWNELKFQEQHLFDIQKEV